MASSDITSALANLESPSTPQQNKPSGYSKLLHQILASPTPQRLSSNLAAFIDSLLGEGLGIVAARPLLGSFVEALKTIANAETKIQAGQHALQALQPRVVSFEEQDALIREILADAFQEQEDYTDAAKVLEGIQLNSSQRKISDDERVKTWIRICRCYLEEDDTTSAETYLNRAKTLLYKVEDKELNLMFQLSQARILDARRKFLEASQAYHTFSFSPVLDEGERTRALSSAIICAVLAPAGPQRSRILAKLYKDERASQVEEYGILEKMFLDRLLSPAEVSKFADKLQPHQLAQTADGSTVLAKAVIEHNLLGASRLYDNIGVGELGVLLDLNAEKAEEYAARMLEQGRLTGRIDQIDGVIFFDWGEGSGEKTKAGQADRITGRDMRKWDSNVQGLVEEVERVTSLLQSHYSVSSLQFQRNLR
ncbi:COP9 signalosome complex subunit 4 [Hypocenomyce scalaris]|nr:COP9 signalosome complex subunit 4 [Hypocenomyce scalaris]